MAKQFESMESMMVSFSGPDGSTLITERNKRALEVLRQQQAAGKRKLAIFYGAARYARAAGRRVRHESGGGDLARSLGPEGKMRGTVHEREKISHR